MINLSNITAGLVAGLVITSVVPALGATRLHHAARDARAQAIEQSAGGGSTNRDQALRECNDKVAGLRQYSWGVRESSVYRSCMADHGQME